MSRLRELGHRLYAGQIEYDFVGRRRTWYVVSSVILVIAILGLVVRGGLNLGIEFRGGAQFQLPPAATCSIEQARDTAEGAGASQAIVTEVGSGGLRVQTQPLTPEQSNATRDALAAACGLQPSDIAVQLIGPTWGSQITAKALQGLVIFLILVAIFMTIYFELRMAIAGLVALAHDLVITIGIYALVGFEVTPATVIGVLTILGFSLYDTVVVFDKVKENTKGFAGQSRATYGQLANLAVNQTLVRSINTSVIALLPVAAILFVGAGLLGAGTLKDLSLALFVGMAAGTYSSLFVATPLLVQLKERQPEVKAQARRVAARGASRPDRPASAVAVGGESAPTAAAGQPAAGSTARPAGQRNQPRKQSRSRRGGGGQR
ncbi:MAG: protein translocase subunit SecF [Actinomycetota bacterium]|nr:MAG: protein translocase subunit SecF [Actinomycetota bacterium]